MQAAVEETETISSSNRTRIGISLPTPVVEGVDKNKGYDTRSYFIAKAVSWYLDYLEMTKEYENDVSSK
ncbi:MAG: hypothetical protein M3275_00115 [Thermoproteota archaeon]|nr:hypothetical protein [Thermoproteota archaeon]